MNYILSPASFRNNLSHYSYFLTIEPSALRFQRAIPWKSVVFACGVSAIQVGSNEEGHTDAHYFGAFVRVVEDCFTFGLGEGTTDAFGVVADAEGGEVVEVGVCVAEEGADYGEWVGEFGKVDGGEVGG